MAGLVPAIRASTAGAKMAGTSPAMTTASYRWVNLFAGWYQTPILVLPDDVPAHPLVSSVDVASFCPNAAITVFPWREPPELKTRTINRVRNFLRAHRPAS
jgi:hypothetical protein